MITCGWQNENEEARAKFPLSAEFHDKHGAELDLSKCDAWVCDCGNMADSGGFETEPCLCGEMDAHRCDAGGERYRCNLCSKLYDRAGREVEG